MVPKADIDWASTEEAPGYKAVTVQVSYSADQAAARLTEVIDTVYDLVVCPGTHTVTTKLVLFMGLELVVFEAGDAEYRHCFLTDELRGELEEALWQVDGYLGKHGYMNPGPDQKESLPDLEPYLRARQAMLERA